MRNPVGMNKMKIYIYKFENKTNGNVYIGQTNNIERRKYQHKASSFNETYSDYNSQFHQSVRKYGWENFSFEVIEIAEEHNYKDREKFYISKYNSYKNGYNATEGGDAGISQKGESNGRAKLKRAEVLEIRERYGDKEPFNSVYQDFKEIISKRGFQNVWWGRTWKDVSMEVYSSENKTFHNTKAKSSGPKNRLFSNEEVINIRQRRANGEKIKEVYKDFENRCSFSGFENIWYYQTYLTCID